MRPQTATLLRGRTPIPALPVSVGFCLLFLLALMPVAQPAHALERQPAEVYQARRQALAKQLDGGLAVIFAAEQPQLDLMPYRQDEDFYYLTGWNEPGAALFIQAEAPAALPEPGGPQHPQPRHYREILLLPARNLRLEKYTGPKLDASSPDAPRTTGVSEVKPMADLPALIVTLISDDRGLTNHIWSQAGSEQANAFAGWQASVLGNTQPLALNILAGVTTPLRLVKDQGEIALIQKASDASVAAQLAMMKTVQPGVTERAVAGRIIETLMVNGCERPSYASIVGSGHASTTLHYSENTGTLRSGDVVVVDAAGEYSMYASDITRTVPVSGKFTPRQREIYDIVLGAQKAAINAFVAGKSKIGDRDHKDPNSLDTVAWNYINTHGKGLNGQPLSQYWIHSLGHMVGINVHDPSHIPATLTPGMVFTIEPGVYIPEENLGVRIEDLFVVGTDGKLINMTQKLPRTADEVEAIMKQAH